MHSPAVFSVLSKCCFPQELFSPLACGGKLVLAAPGGEKDTQYLAQLIASQGVTFCIYVPSQLDASLQVRCSHLTAADNGGAWSFFDGWSWW